MIYIYINTYKYQRVDYISSEIKTAFPTPGLAQTSARNMINSSSKDDPCVAATCAEDFIGAPNTSTVGREINHHTQIEIAAPHIDGK